MIFSVAVNHWIISLFHQFLPPSRLAFDSQPTKVPFYRVSSSVFQVFIQYGNQPCQINFPHEIRSWSSSSSAIFSVNHRSLVLLRSLKIKLSYDVYKRYWFKTTIAYIKDCSYLTSFIVVFHLARRGTVRYKRFLWTKNCN